MIELHNIEKTYRNKGIPFKALKDVSLNIQDGDFAAIMGHSGCGKTTLMNIMGLMDTFDTGQYLFNGIDISGFNHADISKFRNKNIGFVFQSFNLINDYTVLENVEMPLGYAGITTKKRRDIAIQKLTRLELEDKIKNKPLQLSGGQQQRVAIARALVNEPNIIFADEPTGNLDAKTGEEIMVLLSELHEKGITIVLVTHDEQVAAYAKRRIIINDGKIEN